MIIVPTRYGKMRIIDADKIVSRSLALYGEWATDELNLLGRIIVPGMCVMDIGAFIGTHSLAFSQFVGENGKVYTFEPRKEIYAILSENLTINNCRNVTAFNIGLAEKVAVLELQSIELDKSFNFGGLSLNADTTVKSSDSYQIGISSVDNLRIEKIDVIKLDVEGMERKVLDGAIGLISRDRPTILCECNSLISGSELLSFCQAQRYDSYGYLTAAYNSNNFKNVKENIFGQAKELSLLLVPREKSVNIMDRITSFALVPINNLEDLILPLLHKPQYVGEVLSSTSASTILGLDFPSPAATAHLGKIAALSNTLVERNGQIASQQHEITELRISVETFRNSAEAFRNSYSWRITRPLRKVAHWQKRIAELTLLYKKYRHIYPGFLGHLMLIFKCSRIIWKGGIGNLRNRINYYENSHILNGSIPKNMPTVHQALKLDENSKLSDGFSSDVAVHAHIYYSDLAQDVFNYLRNIPINFQLYITTNTTEKAKMMESLFAGLKNIKGLEVHISENRGRDILPMIVVLGARLAKHDLVLHIHTKRSPHNSLALSGWRRFLMESLLGSPERVISILHEFEKDKALGILFPNYYHPIRSFVNDPNDDSNDEAIKTLLIRSGKKKADLVQIDRTLYPAGNMFWFRGKAIEPLVKMNLKVNDFDLENGQLNGTLAHGIERMFPYFASQLNLNSKPFLAKSFLSEECSSHNLDLLQTYSDRELIVNPTILFDHNGGGGTNIYTAELIKGLSSNGGSTLRVYCSNAIWFIQWIGNGDGMLFHTDSVEELFKALNASRSVNIVINSLYGYPDIDLAVTKIISLSHSLRCHIDVKFHDFFALCPSPHLSDFEGKYCGVPKEAKTCEKCLKKNLGWYHSWYPKENMPSEIGQWRLPFAKLLESASRITFFDKSSVEIARKAFVIEDEKIKIVPHADDHFDCVGPIDFSGPLRIGTLGTLSQIKGGDVVSTLYKYIEEMALSIPITVVGASIVATPKKVIVHGSYYQKELPSIVKKYGINVILIPSIVPETFGYTISEAIKMGLPVVAFDLGAQGNRVKEYALGRVVPLGSKPGEILEAIQHVLKMAREINK